MTGHRVASIELTNTLSQGRHLCKLEALPGLRLAAFVSGDHNDGQIGKVGYRVHHTPAETIGSASIA